ncbi:MAG: hypothetical protein HY231_12935 [Acidobacteria bacterium]|nr:hypothetical protein [Acidobacteriota bacterium]
MQNLNLTPELAKQLLAEAAAHGISVTELLEAVIESAASAESNAAQEEHFQHRATPEEWAKAIRELVENFPQKAPPLSDYAVSRESIYAERKDSQL